MVSIGRVAVSDLPSPPELTTRLREMPGIFVPEQSTCGDTIPFVKSLRSSHTGLKTTVCFCVRAKFYEHHSAAGVDRFRDRRVRLAPRLLRHPHPGTGVPRS